jgi:aconitase A
MVREAAKKFMLENGKEVVASESFDRLHESKSLVREIMTAAFESSSDSEKRRREDE